MILHTHTHQRSDEFCGFVGPTSDEELQALPYYGNNAYLMDVLRQKAGVELSSRYMEEVEEKGYVPFFIGDHIEAESLQPESDGRKSGLQTMSTHNVVPITVWVYRRNDGSGALVNNADVENIMSEVRAIYEPTGLRLYMVCGVNFVNNTNFFNIDDYDQFIDMVTTNRVLSTLNLHLVNRVFDNNTLGVATFPLDPNVPARYSAAISLSRTEGVESNVIAHEIGHNLGLMHTHHGRCTLGFNGGCTNNCHQESVSRSRNQGLFCLSTGDKKCEVNGDMLCDTPADPLLSEDNVNANCNVIPFFLNPPTDNWGDAWQPDATNVMAYGRLECLTTFSASQVAIMYDNLHSNWTATGSISGPANLCSGQTATYSAPNGASSYNWQVPPGWTINSGQGTRHAQITAGTGSGMVRVLASCGFPRLDQYVNVSPSQVNVTGPNSMCPNDYTYFSVPSVLGATYNWSVFGVGLNILSGQGSNSIYVHAAHNFSGGYLTVSYTTQGGCSGTGSQVVSQSYNCPFSLEGNEISESDGDSGPIKKSNFGTDIGYLDGQNVLEIKACYPNPSNELVNLQMVSPGRFGLELLNAQGRTVMSKEFGPIDTSFSVRDFPAGLYILKISQGKNKIATKIQITK